MTGTIPPSPSPQQQLLWQPQRLPNECLFHIVEYLSTDLVALHSLLTVNKFFFHAALPHIFNDPINTWDTNYAYSKHKTNNDKLFALVFVSFLQARLEECQCDLDDDLQINQTLDRILKQFGLKLTLPFLPSGLDMLECIDWRCRLLHGDEIRQFCRNRAQRLTLDYSKLFTVLSMDDWRFFQYFTMVRLRKLPDDMRERQTLRRQNGVISNDQVSANIETDHEAADGINPTMTAIIVAESNGESERSEESDSDEDGTHTFEQQYDLSYTWQLRQSLIGMWLHYNHESVTSFAFDMAEAQKYHSLSTKMSRLQVLHLNRTEAMPDPHLENTILFIKQNQAAFPRKRPLDIEFNEGWYSYYDNDDDTNHSPELDIYNARRKKLREQRFRFMKPAFAIYGAIGRPTSMQADNIPNFYDQVKHIDLDQLRVFSDTDTERIDQVERAGMEAFLRRCENLKKLKLGIGNYDTLSWAAVDAQDSTLPPSRRALKNLESLEIETTKLSHYVIQAFNDSMVAFSSSLRNIDVRSHCGYRENEVPIAMRNAATMESLRLQRLVTANTIGDCPLLLPHLRTIRISLYMVACVNIGSFDMCPNLEELEIRFGCFRPDQCRPAGDEPPLLIPESGELVDRRWRQPEIDNALFPKWNLPKLKQLMLYDMAAMKFRFASLSTMLNLETLTLSVNQKLCHEQGLDEYVKRQYEISTSQSLTASNNQSEQGPESFDSNTPLVPNLREISLEGPPSTLIYLDCLKSFPKLESLSLSSVKETYEIHRNALFGSSSIFYPKSPQNDESCDADEDAPYFESHLKKLTLNGGWLMSEQDLTSLLTTYAPFLEELTVTRLQGGSLNGYKFLEAISIADEINGYEPCSLNIQSNQRSFPGRNLATVNCKYTVRKSDLRDLGMLPISEADEDMYRDRGFRIYKILDRVLVRREDYDYFFAEEDRTDVEINE
ncbi:hypothetical protein BGZ80_001619 [Entomortierella chlamydospora]|uniref:F-box domain-containing protein n=1 Tax=Entomortierella chlamydospora TaxID=101097 RepID=A0A9P6MQK8_9FUNG|nr:hypothetical protein BGZ79_000863 [Entomortierella chlamydospora]KAG0010287.1 hypothetical protein BGZ80_001619 [Entomortierella chlamydospora]